MPSLVRALCRSALAALLLVGGATVQAEPATAPLPPAEAFFNNPAFGDARLSPSAKYLAARSSAPGRHDFLAVIDLQANTPKVVAAYDDGDVGDFQWVNDERLVFDTRDKTLGPGDVRYAPGLYAVNRDGSNLVQLAERTGGGLVAGDPLARKLLPWHTYLLRQRGAQESDFIYVQSPQFDTAMQVRYVNLLRLNTVTGKAQAVPRPAGKVSGWMLDQNGEPRLATSFDEDMVTIHYRDPANGQWRKLASYRAYAAGAGDAINPLGFGADGTLYVEARGGKDTSSVYSFNLETGKINPSPLIVTTGYDFNGNLINGGGKLLGIQFTTDATSIEWFDTSMKAMQETVDKLLPATVNLISLPARPQAPWVLVRSYSDAIPLSFALYNTQTRQINKIADTRPGINPAQMGRQQFVRYKARDGLEIPALLTLPPGAKRSGLPLVVLVHGGPYVRGASWGWNRESQFLASRGYAVLEPEYRGSTGFGVRHFKAGWKQWGLAMQDDIADGARWTIAKGLVDPKRICIAGASYGGYATLMGLVNDPGLYKCGVDWVGVTDINLLYNGSWNFASDLGEEWKKYGMPDMVGDQVKDAAQLKATSPLAQAARITQPVLMAYGGVDVRVPIYHGHKFYDAVTRTNKNVEWIEYPEEAHGWRLPKNNIDFWTRVERFLDKNIGKGAVQE
jgi:dipeptidyl aminopeptidase/acylaminoacyl peptidase